MTESLTSDQRSLADVVQRFLAERLPAPGLRATDNATPAFNPSVWHEFAKDLGCGGLLAPIRYGGVGATFVEVGLVLEELGRVLAELPFLSSVVLAQSALLAANDEAILERWLPGLVDGSVRGTVAFAEPADRWGQFRMAANATPAGEGWTISGEKGQVLDGSAADMTLVFAQAPGGLSLFVVEAGAPGLQATPSRTLDLTRGAACLRFDETPAQIVGAEGSADKIFADILTVAAAGLAAEQFGGSARLLDMSTDYARSRVQFGRPIGSFQAIKNKCVDMFIRVESSRVASRRAAQALAGGLADANALASLAKAYCSDAYWWIAGENIQVHGGIGFTWEHPAHLYYRRAQSTKLMFGTPDYHRELLASCVSG